MRPKATCINPFNSATNDCCSIFPAYMEKEDIKATGMFVLANYYAQWRIAA